MAAALRVMTESARPRRPRRARGWPPARGYVASVTRVQVPAWPGLAGSVCQCHEPRRHCHGSEQCDVRRSVARGGTEAGSS